jgi:acetylornithine deacetylase/succinyl-diaminopimelate desuccinylase-like protein
MWACAGWRRRPGDKQMRDLFVEWARAAGCSIEIDRLGDIFARRVGSEPSLPPVAIGSHLDAQSAAVVTTASWACCVASKSCRR